MSRACTRRTSRTQVGTPRRHTRRIRRIRAATHGEPERSTTMDDQQILGIIGQGGVGAGLLYLLWKIGTRIVASLDKVAEKLDEHTRVDLEHHGHVREQLAEMRGELGAVVRAPTNGGR